MTLGDKITMLRKFRKISQAVLAEKIGISRDAIVRYERGEILPIADKAKKIADVLGVSLDYLMSDADHTVMLDGEMVNRILEIQKLPESEKDKIVSVIDAFIRDCKTKSAYGNPD